MGRLTGKVAVVFGAGPNIGGTIAHFIGREGAKVVVVDLNLPVAEETAQFLKSRGYECTAMQGNAVSEPSVSSVIEKTVAHYGRVDAIVNMAGKIHWAPVTEMELEDWTASLTSFPTAGMLTTKHAARAMIKAGHGGSIIHILSTAAHFGEASGAAYCSAKAGLLNFARCAAMDLAHDQIRVNTITPCSMEHQLWTLMKDEVEDPNFVPPNTRSFYSRDDYLKMIPLERFCRPSDLAWAAVFLASDESTFLTGVDIPVDGGLRFKYPTWRPGDHTGVNISDYLNQIKITRYGEEGEPLRAAPSQAK
ncbi:SDR family oxidoreductase [Roseiarcaceae bacterium H3SJ34-1]|uniref:SDR family NAD(P)-dependent oxidoreductase n=1 Tax=Terripilifer ovatus TaxID=3032367 RepID=UPI003AB933ED|nr:SDR family oxidoreductase [Roseiarcaceae bacterium H3SJ34-1]